jgi:hypothetical protein
MSNILWSMRICKRTFFLVCRMCGYVNSLVYHSHVRPKCPTKTKMSDQIVGLRECWLSNLSDILGGIWSLPSLVQLCCVVSDIDWYWYSTLQVYQRSYSQVRHIPPKMSDKFLHTGKKVRLQICIDHKMFDIFTSRNVKTNLLISTLTSDQNVRPRPKCPTK